MKTRIRLYILPFTGKKFHFMEMVPDARNPVYSEKYTKLLRKGKAGRTDQLLPAHVL